MKINQSKIGINSPCYIIAELSANHNRNLQNALKTIKAAKEIGANAVKIQTYTADTITLNVKNKDFLIDGGTLWDGRNLYELYEEAHTPWEWHQELFDYAHDIGIDIFSSPFDKSAVDFLEQFNPPAYKIASFVLPIASIKSLPGAGSGAVAIPSIISSSSKPNECTISRFIDRTGIVYTKSIIFL